jgi:hypothetical protein
MGSPITSRRSRAAGHTGGRRRHLQHPLAALAAVALLALSACAAGASQPGGGASGQAEPPPGIVPPGEWTEEQETRMVDMVTEAEEKLPQFNDQSQLEALGFVNIGVLAAGYSHYVNVGWFTDEHILNPDFPESLVYAPTGEVVAAMYFLGPEYNLDNLPADIAWLPGWHAHPELCTDDQGRVVGFAFGGQCTRGQPALVPMMHVWITDPGCGHRFGGLGVGGLECDYNHEHGAA